MCCTYGRTIGEDGHGLGVCWLFELSRVVGGGSARRRIMVLYWICVRLWSLLVLGKDLDT